MTLVLKQLGDTLWTSTLVGLHLISLGIVRLTVAFKRKQSVASKIAYLEKERIRGPDVSPINRLLDRQVTNLNTDK